MTDLILPVRRKWFEQIKAGTKTEEYRQITPHWQTRILYKSFDRVVITLGYPKKDDTERRLSFPYYGFAIKDIESDEFGGYARVFAIQIEPEKNDIQCPYCGEPLRDDEKENPHRADDGEILCDECYDENYREWCDRCGEKVDKDQIDSQPGKLIAIWDDAPASGEDLRPGYYRVKSCPFFADYMVGGNFFSFALERVADLDEKGIRAAEDAPCISGPLCNDCQTEIEKTEK